MNPNSPLPWEFPRDHASSLMEASSNHPPLLRGVDQSTRHLTERRNTDGTLAVLMIVFALFCFIWAPVMLRRCRGLNNTSANEDVHDLARFEAEARAVRATLQRMSMIGNMMEERSNQNHHGDPHSLELEHRREFLDSALLTKKVIFQSQLDEKDEKEDEAEDEAKDDDDDSSSKSSCKPKDRKLPRRQKSNVIVLVNTIKHKKENTADTRPKEEDDDDSSAVETTDEESSKEKEENNSKEKCNSQEEPPQSSQELPTEEDSQEIEPCSICMEEYNDGDEICWSHNENCSHFFHKACIQEWLLTHEECPCCRQDFLCLRGDDDQGNEHRPRRHSYRTPASTTSLDWAEELAEEIQERILQRQRHLQAELQRRERQQQMLQLQQQLYSVSSPAALVATSNPRQRNNTVISVDDMAAGFLLYRHFPMQFASDPRRHLALSSALERDRRNDIEVAHFTGMTHRLQPWQTYRPHEPIVVGNVFEMVDQSSNSRRRHLPSQRRSFFSTSSPPLDHTTRSRSFVASGASESGTNDDNRVVESRPSSRETTDGNSTNDDNDEITASA